MNVIHSSASFLYCILFLYINNFYYIQTIQFDYVRKILF